MTKLTKPGKEKMMEGGTVVQGFNKVTAIKKFFEGGQNGRAVTMAEMKALSPDERTELGTMAAKAMGAELKV